MVSAIVGVLTVVNNNIPSNGFSSPVLGYCCCRCFLMFQFSLALLPVLRLLSFLLLLTSLESSQWLESLLLLPALLMMSRTLVFPAFLESPGPDVPALSIVAVGHANSFCCCRRFPVVAVVLSTIDIDWIPVADVPTATCFQRFWRPFATVLVANVSDVPSASVLVSNVSDVPSATVLVSNVSDVPSASVLVSNVSDVPSATVLFPAFLTSLLLQYLFTSVLTSLLLQYCFQRFWRPFCYSIVSSVFTSLLLLAFLLLLASLLLLTYLLLKVSPPILASLLLLTCPSDVHVVYCVAVFLTAVVSSLGSLL